MTKKEFPRKWLPRFWEWIKQFFNKNRALETPNHERGEKQSWPEHKETAALLLENCKKKLNQIEEKYYPMMLAYAMFQECIRQQLPVHIEKQIEKDFQNVKAMPVIKFTEELSLDEYGQLQKAVDEYLMEKHFVAKDIQADTRFETYLFKKAQKEAQEKIKEY